MVDAVLRDPRFIRPPAYRRKVVRNPGRASSQSFRSSACRSGMRYSQQRSGCTWDPTRRGSLERLRRGRQYVNCCSDVREANLSSASVLYSPHGQALDPLARIVRLRQVDLLEGCSGGTRSMARTGYGLCLLQHARRRAVGETNRDGCGRGRTSRRHSADATTVLRLPECLPLLFRAPHDFAVCSHGEPRLP